MTATEIDTDSLVENYIALARAKAKGLVRELRERGVPADPDDLESDAAYFLLQSAGKWSQEVCSKTSGFFTQALNKWVQRRRARAVRDWGRNRTESLPEDFDCEDDTPGLSDRDAVQLERSLLSELGKVPKVGKELQRVGAMVLYGHKTLNEIVQEVGKSRYYETIRPALQEALGWEDQAVEGE